MDAETHSAGHAIVESPESLRARARGTALALVAELWARGLTVETADAWRRLAGFEGLVPDEIDPDEAAAEHHRLAVAELFPYESVFLHPEGLLGGEEAAAVRDLRLEVGLDEPRELEVDHLAEELRLLAFLAGLERVARRGEARLEAVQDDQRQLLDAHLLRWLPGFAAVVAQAETGGGQGGLYAQATRMALDICLDWRRELGGTAARWQLPEAPEDLLDRERTGLATISRHLCVPAMAGGFLGTAALRLLGRSLDLPRGFGKRWQELESLLQAAAHYSAVPRVIDGLLGELDLWERSWAVLDGELSPLAAPWLERIAESRVLLRRMQQAAEVETATGEA